MVLLHHQFKHSRTVEPITEIDAVPISVNFVGPVVEFLEAFVKEAVAVIAKFKPLTTDPELRQAAVQLPLKVVNTPKRLNADNSYVRYPSPCFFDSSGRIPSFPDLKTVSVLKYIQIARINTVDAEYL